MRISSARLSQVEGALDRGLENARAGWAQREGLLLRLGDGAGHVGQGEASPLPRYSIDTFESCRATLLAVLEDLPEVPEETSPLAAVRMMVQRVAPGQPAAAFGLETAMVDLIGKRLGLPSWQVWGLGGQEGEAWPVVSALWQGGAASPPPPVPLNALIDLLPIEAGLAQGWRALERGIRTLKVKVGRPGRFQEELELLRAMRAELESFTLRLDANGGLPLEEAPARLDALAAFDPVFIEEPVAVESMPKLRASPVPVAVDESLQRPGSWTRLRPLIEGGVCRFLVLKPMALGGAARCLELARLGREAGLEIVVTHLLDGPVALAAAAALALAIPGVLACGLEPHPGLSVWPPVDLPFLTPSEIRPLATPGLGLPPIGPG